MPDLQSLIECYGRFCQRRSMASELTHLLEAIDRGDSTAAAELLTLVYSELRRMAAGKMARESAGHTLQPTALVHEAWMRLEGDGLPRFENRAHFFAAAAEAMRRILIDRARRRLAAKRGAGAASVPIDEVEIPSPTANEEHLLAVNEALEKLARLDPRKADLVKLRYFVGLSFEEAAAELGIAVPTAKQWWAYARAWLSVEIKGPASDTPPRRP
jgi:RNA polymerase sigma factor (TIGR02999 family)